MLRGGPMVSQKSAEQTFPSILIFFSCSFFYLFFLCVILYRLGIIMGDSRAKYDLTSCNLLLDVFLFVLLSSSCNCRTLNKEVGPRGLTQVDHFLFLERPDSFSAGGC